MGSFFNPFIFCDFLIDDFKDAYICYRYIKKKLLLNLCSSHNLYKIFLIEYLEYFLFYQILTNDYVNYRRHQADPVVGFPGPVGVLILPGTGM